MKHTCCVCRREHEGCEVITLTDEEKSVMQKAGYTTVPDTLAYCKPCWRILGNKEQGAQLMRGIGEITLRRLGVVNAEDRASRFHTGLLAKAKT